MRILPIILIIMIGVISSNVCAAVGEEVKPSAKTSNEVDKILKDLQMKAPKYEDNLRLQYPLEQMKERKFYVTLVATMSMISLVVVLILMRKSSPKADDIVLVFGLNFVIFGTIISVLAVTTQEQLAAVTGILGAMGGYLFGAKGRESGVRKDTESQYDKENKSDK